MKTCDVCKAKVDDLVLLREIYQTDEIKEICRPCEKIVNKKLDSLQSVTSNIQRGWLKRFMENFSKDKA